MLQTLRSPKIPLISFRAVTNRAIICAFEKHFLQVFLGLKQRETYDIVNIIANVNHISLD